MITRPKRSVSALSSSTPRSGGCSTQTCDLNALSRSASYRRFISSIDPSPSGPEPLKIHAQFEQVHPSNRSRSTHTISRAKGRLHQARFCGGGHHNAAWTPSQEGHEVVAKSVNLSATVKIYTA